MINKPTLMYVTAVNIKKSHISFSYRYISELYSFVSVCVYYIYSYIYNTYLHNQGKNH